MTNKQLAERMFESFNDLQKTKPKTNQRLYRQGMKYDKRKNNS